MSERTTTRNWGDWGLRLLALGITEETDAVAVVVSEETGVISVAFNGELIRDLDSNSLRNTLYKYLVTDLYPQGPQGKKP